MRRLPSERSPCRRVKRAGAALAIVLVLIAVFGMLCQTLTVLAAIQHRQAFHQADQAQARRLAEGGLVRARGVLARAAQWTGETWKPPVPGGGSTEVQISVTRSPRGAHLRAVAQFTTSAGRIHKSNQTLDVPAASVPEAPESSTP
jgi:hypothetical protein